ncbi:Mini-chromosome maintenance complex-binding protein [Cynara cardunculus var. scolymus]|uniref:Mini-chromosome maintenance complex-binding protein n=1 Tax=Cynara cardunculus var. scolymus TaxID=59895 RepID=A0A103Y971_CYNCS|nr:Mini-chromosome maintenance complex-binding protein [Cynara cardunculus var. scolymus]
MVGRQYDCLVNPLGAVRFTFEKAVASGSDPASFDRKDWGVADLFREFLFDSDGLSQVPILTPSTVQLAQPNTLVRFRGMIQDMLGNEFYVGAYKNEDTWNTNKFTDVSQFPMGTSPNMRVWERRLLYCVPVPGQNSWADSTSEGVIYPCTNVASANREKRLRENCSVSADVDMQDSSNDLSLPPCAKKMRGEFSPSENITEGTDCGTSMVLDSDGNDFACLVKIYDSPESDLKLNDVFEFIGVLTYDTEVKFDKGGDNELANSFPEDESVNLPPSKVPRLHCLVHRKLSVDDMILSSPAMEPKPHLVKGMRESLLRHLTAVLGDDELAAHFMLLHLLSKVHARVDSFAVGKLSLNLTGFDKASISVFGNRINDAVKNLVPFSHRMPLTVEYLNTASLAPVKDYQTNRLVCGVLQCAEGSHLTIDETSLEAGTLNSNGVENTKILKDLMEFQMVEYDFKYYKMKMNADVQLLILSEGKSNIIPADLVVPFHPSSVGPLGTVDAETLNAWRWYLATLRSLPHSIETEMQKMAKYGAANVSELW